VRSAWRARHRHRAPRQRVPRRSKQPPYPGQAVRPAPRRWAVPQSKLLEAQGSSHLGWIPRRCPVPSAWNHRCRAERLPAAALGPRGASGMAIDCRGTARHCRRMRRDVWRSASAPACRRRRSGPWQNPHPQRAPAALIPRRLRMRDHCCGVLGRWAGWHSWQAELQATCQPPVSISGRR
jgi:hypothetical protein